MLKLPTLWSPSYLCSTTGNALHRDSKKVHRESKRQITREPG
ncbi:hypothetical protein [Moorena producens]